jgi:hypothetical protein
MILFIHAIFGAAIGQNIQNLFLAIILSFLSHYLLDFLPHSDYSWSTGKFPRIKNLLKASTDFLTGLILILFFSNNQLNIYICAFFAILPDIITIFSRHTKIKLLKIYNTLHWEKIHYFHYKKIPIFLRILSQFFIVILALYLLKR